MNKRMRELAKDAEKFYVQECTASVSHFRFEGYVPKQFLEKFAELIIRECADISYSVGEHGYIASQEMKEHFGVKE